VSRVHRIDLAAIVGREKALVDDSAQRVDALGCTDKRDRIGLQQRTQMVWHGVRAILARIFHQVGPASMQSLVNSTIARSLASGQFGFRSAQTHPRLPLFPRAPCAMLLVVR